VQLVSGVIALVAVAAFAVAFVRLGIIPLAVNVIATAKRTAALIRDPGATDDRKETAAQAASISMFRDFANITVRAALALLVAAAPIFAAEWLDLVRADAVLDLLLDPVFVVVVTLVFVAGWFIRAKMWPAR
jgi:hypothetical protein